MSTRIEWTLAKSIRPGLQTRGDFADDGGRITHPLCLFLGPLAIEGTREELHALLDAAHEKIEEA